MCCQMFINACGDSIPVPVHRKYTFISIFYQMIATTWTNFLNKGKKRNIPYDKKNYCAVEWITFSSSQNNKTQISTSSWESLFPNMFIAKQKLTTGLSSTLKLLDHFFAFPLYVYEKTLKTMVLIFRQLHNKMPTTVLGVSKTKTSKTKTSKT